MKTRTKESKKGLRKAVTAVMATVLCLTSTIGVFAGTGGNVSSPAKAVLTKTFQYADNAGLTTPTATFQFDFTAKTEDGATPSAAMPAIASKSLNFTAADNGILGSNGTLEAVKSTTDVLSGLTWTHTGAYVYNVVENAAATTFTPGTGEGITHSQADYDLTVVVSYDNGTGSYFVESTYLNQNTGNNGGTGTGKGNPDPGTNGGNNDFNYVNTFTTLGGSGNGSDALTITNAVAGTGSDPSKQFDYTITMDDSASAMVTGTYVGTITRADGTTATINVVADGTATTFTLADGEELVFTTLPAGTTYEVEQTGVNGYITSYTGQANGSAINDANLVANANLTTGSQTIGLNTNEADFLNTYDTSLIPTGIFMNNLPYIAMIAVAMLALVAVATLNKRKEVR